MAGLQYGEQAFWEVLARERAHERLGTGETGREFIQSTAGISPHLSWACLDAQCLGGSERACRVSQHDHWE